MGVVYHANYLNWFELGRTEMIRELGLPYRALEERGLLLPVVEAELKFRHPAKYDDRIAVYTAIEEWNHLRMQFVCEVRRLPEGAAAGAAVDAAEAAEAKRSAEAGATPEGELLVTGRTKHVWINRAWRPVRIDREAPDLYALLGG